MATNYPGPHEFRIYYGVASYTHVMRLNCNVIDVGAGFATLADLTLQQRQGTVQADTALEAFVDLLKPLYPSTNAVFQYAELYQYEPESFESAFLLTHDLSVAGTAGGSYSPASQVIFVFRTDEGGVMRLSPMNSVKAPGQLVQYSALGVPEKAIVDFIISDNNWILGRDTSYPRTFKSMYPGQNEALWKKIYRNS